MVLQDPFAGLALHIMTVILLCIPSCDVIIVALTHNHHHPQLSLQDLLVCNKHSLLHPLHLSPSLPKWTVLPSLQLHATSPACHAGTVYIGVHDMHGGMHPNLHTVIESLIAAITVRPLLYTQSIPLWSQPYPRV